MSRWYFIFECFPSESPSLHCFSLSSSLALPGSSRIYIREFIALISPLLDHPLLPTTDVSILSILSMYCLFVCRYYIAFLGFFPACICQEFPDLLCGKLSGGLQKWMRCMLLAVVSCVLLLIALKSRLKTLFFCIALFFVMSKYCIHMENND